MGKTDVAAKALSELRALAAAVQRAGVWTTVTILGTLDETGTVAVGKRADLVLLAGNPLQDIRHTREPAGMMIDGRWLDRAALDQGLLAFGEYWSTLEVEGSFYPAPTVPLTREETMAYQERQQAQSRRFEELSDSLQRASSPEYYKAAQQRLVDEFVALRALLTTDDQRDTFDAMARVWLREQARRGHRVVVPGVAPTC
jgi:hypothetical protein